MRKVAVHRYPFLNETFPFKNEQNPARPDIHPHSNSPPMRQRFNEIVPPPNTHKMVSPLSVKALKTSTRGPSPPPLRGAYLDDRLNTTAMDILARKTQEYHYILEQNYNMDIKGQTILIPNNKDMKMNGSSNNILNSPPQLKGKHPSDEVNLKTLARVINHEIFNKTGEKILAVASSVGGGKQKIIKNYNDKLHSPLDDLKNKLNIKKVNKPKFIKIIKGTHSSSRHLILNSNGGTPKVDTLGQYERDSSVPKKMNNGTADPNFTAYIHNEKTSPRRNYHGNSEPDNESFLSEVDDSGLNSRSPHFQANRSFKTGKPNLFMRGQTHELSDDRRSPETTSSSNPRIRFENKNYELTRLSNSSLGNNTESPPLQSRKMQPNVKVNSTLRVGSPNNNVSRSRGNSGDDLTLKPSYLISSAGRPEMHNSTSNSNLNKTVNLASIRETQSTDENDRHTSVLHSSPIHAIKGSEIFEKFNHSFNNEKGGPLGNPMADKSNNRDNFDTKTPYTSNNSGGLVSKSKTVSSRWKYADQTREAGKLKENSKKTFDILARTDNNFSGWDVRESYESEENARSLYNKINNILDDDGYDY